MIVMKQDARAFVKGLGAHVTGLRKSCGMTQAQLARAIGVSQQAVFAYETGDRRISVFILMRLARVFGLTLDELAGMKRTIRPPRGRLSARSLRDAHRLQALPKTQQRFLLRILDQLEGSNKE